MNTGTYVIGGLLTIMVGIGFGAGGARSLQSPALSTSILPDRRSVVNKLNQTQRSTLAAELPGPAALCFTLVMVFSLFSASTALAATFVVGTDSCDAPDDLPGDGKCKASCPRSDFCTLRAAMQEAEDPFGDESNTITFDTSPVRISLESALPVITKNLTISGPGATVAEVRANGDYSVFQVVGDGITVNLSGLTIRGGNPPSSRFGGGVSISGNRSFVNINSCIITSNRALEGGGIYNLNSTVNIRKTIIRNNGARLGGGIFNRGGTLTVENSVIHNNRADTMFSDNRTPTGGGIYNNPPTSGGPAAVRLTNTTVSDNTAHRGGGIVSEGITGGPATFSIVNSTVSHNNGAINSQGGGILVAGSGTLTLTNSIIAQQGATGGDCFNASPTTHEIVSGGNNLDSDTSCILVAAGDLPGLDPLLGPLDDNFTLNGTQTRALLPGSPAIDVGANVGCPPIDQRGRPRPRDGNGDQMAVCDIGAYEVQSADVPSPEPDTTGGGGGGGCSLDRGRSFDPTLLALLALAIGYLGWNLLRKRSHH